MKAIDHYESAVRGWHVVRMNMGDNPADIEKASNILTEWLQTNGIATWYIQDSSKYRKNEKECIFFVEILGKEDAILLYLAFV